MPKQPARVMLDVSISPASDVPLHRQLYSAVRALILDGRLRSGERLPSTRVMARDLRVSRTTVVNALEQLALEGYVQGRVGSGTRVAPSIPIDVRRLTLTR